MSPERFDHLLGLVGPVISRQTTNFRSAISPGERLAITLRYLVTGNPMQTISFNFRVGHSAVCGIMDNDALWNVLVPEYLRRPATQEEWKVISRNFESIWNLPHCVGAINRKHVVIQAPINSGSSFYNYKGTFSIVLLAVCDARYCFMLLDIGDAGRHSDGGVLANSTFGQAMEGGRLSLPDPTPLPGQTAPFPYFFVRDAAFPLKTYMLQPYPGKFLPESQGVRYIRVFATSGGLLHQGVHYIRVFTTSGCSLHQVLHYIRVFTTSGCSLHPGVHYIRVFTASGCSLHQGVCYIRVFTTSGCSLH